MSGEMVKNIRLADMDLRQIAGSGQCFRWKETKEGFWIIQAMGRYLEAEQKDGRFSFSCSEEEFQEIWRPYFDLERDYGALKSRIDPSDSYLKEAVKYGGGIRVLKQDLWEVMVSFLISQNNNIPRIKNSVDALCRTYGQASSGRSLRGTETVFYPFPGPDVLSQAQEEDFYNLGLGYRAKYLKHLADQMKDGGLEELKRRLEASGDEEAREILTSFYGIGRKVADCICLFGLHRADMFPIDTHMKKILANHYGEGGFPFQRYSGFLGAVQQYLFYYDLKG